jgi:23S rRNA (cytosine1962-C5)-methyltransferase
MENQIKIFCSKDWTDYELLDTGEGEKLERFGEYTFVRPYEDAVWPKCSTPSVQQMWKNADGKFWSSKVGAKAGWKMSTNTKGNPWGNLLKGSPLKWEMEYRGIKFFASPTPFRHLGFFPEQASHWDFIGEKIAKQVLSHGSHSNLNVVNESNIAYAEESTASQSSKIKFLNLFGYTGVASLFALRAGAEVTHVDASGQVLKWAKENQKLNTELAEMPMRIIEDDVIKFLEREEKRGNKYDAVIMDPPKFGRGPKGEVWKIEENLSKLLSQVKKVLNDKPLFVILTSYATEASSLSLGNALAETMKDFKGEVKQGELCVLEKSNKRLISLANTAIWSADMI